MIIDGNEIRKNIHEHYDAVIIGSGAAGAVLAKELSEGGMRVAVIEEGAHHPVHSHKDVAYEAIKRLYRGKGFTTTVGKPAIPVPTGMVLGGTTVINSGTCFRTPKTIFDHWNKNLGLTDLNEEEFAPIFDRVEKEINVIPADFNVMSKSNVLFHELLSKKGIVGHPLRRNIKNCEGCGFCCYGCPSGAKQSMDLSYLPKAFSFGAVAYTNTRFDQFLFEKGKVIGVLARFLKPNRSSHIASLKIYAKFVIVCGGAIHTPQLLRNNSVAIDNKNLGKNLTLHPATKVYALFDEEINGWQGTPQAYYSDVLQKEGITLEGIFVPPDVAAFTVPYVGKKLIEFMKNYRRITSFGFLIEDSSTGRVMKLPFLGTTVFYNLNEEDVLKVKKGVLFLARIFLEGGAKKVFTLLHGHTEIQNESDLQKLERAKINPEDIECMAFHPLGSCRMGASPQKGVVDQNYRVFGVQNLYVCDGSVIPSSLGVNPQETIMAFATRLAFQLLKK